MKERLTAALVVCGVILAILCKPCKQFPLLRSGSGDDCDGREELPSFSSRYREMDYDEAAMKLLMEMLLRQHNSLSEEDDVPSYETEESEHLNSGVDGYQSQFPMTENSLHRIANTLPNNKSMRIVSSQNHGSEEQNDSNQFLHHSNQIKSKDNSAEFQEKIISKTFEELTSINEPEQFLRILDDDNRFDSIQPTHAERINMKTYDEREIEDSGKPVAIVRATQSIPDSSVSHKNMLSSKYKDTKRTSKLNVAHSIIPLLPRLFDGFTETLPLNYREHFKMPTTKPKKKINSLEPVDRDQDVRGEIQLEILNRPISAGKPMATPPPGVDVGVGCDRNATSCKPNNKKPINSIKVKIGGQNLAKMTMAMSTRTTSTTTERGIFGKPGIRFENSNPSSVSSKPDGNLISALASIVDSDENDAKDSDEEKDENGEYSDEKEDLDEYSDTSDVENRKNFALPKDPPMTPTPTTTESDEDDGDTSSDVISSIIEELNALIRRQTA